MRVYCLAESFIKTPNKNSKTGFSYEKNYSSDPYNLLTMNSPYEEGEVVVTLSLYRIDTREEVDYNTTSEFDFKYDHELLKKNEFFILKKKGCTSLSFGGYTWLYNHSNHEITLSNKPMDI